MAYLLPQQQLNKYKQAFSVYAKNGDGTMSTNDLGALLTSLGQKLTQAELQDAIKEVDAKGSKKIDLNQFLGLMAENSWEQEPDEEGDEFDDVQ